MLVASLIGVENVGDLERLRFMSVALLAAVAVALFELRRRDVVPAGQP